MRPNTIDPVVGSMTRMSSDGAGTSISDRFHRRRVRRSSTGSNKWLTARSRIAESYAWETVPGKLSGAILTVLSETTSGQER